MNEPQAPLTLKNLLVPIIVLSLIAMVMTWAHYQLRSIEEGERLMDREAERYLEEQDSLERLD